MEGRLTPQEYQNVKDSIEAIFGAIPRTKRFDYLGSLNVIYLFLEAVARELSLAGKSL
jgi:hypothetical protein